MFNFFGLPTTIGGNVMNTPGTAGTVAQPARSAGQHKAEGAEGRCAPEVVEKRDLTSDVLGPRPSPPALLEWGLQSGHARPVVPAIPAIPAEAHKSSPTTYKQLGQLVAAYLKGMSVIDPENGMLIQRYERTFRMAAEFVYADQLPYEVAIAIAIEVVGTCPVAPCETMYEDVITMWLRLQGNRIHPPY